MASSNDTNFSASVDDGSMDAVLQNYQHVKSYDATKAAFVDDLVERLKYVSGRLITERVEFDQERRRMQQYLKTLNHNGAYAVGFEERDPFVMVLIDGNEIVFRNSFLRDGDRGGRQAAKMLYQTVNEYAFSTIEDLPDNTKVVVRIYLDLDDLSTVCLRAGIVDHANKIKTFVRGFCQDRALFDLVDVGMQGQATVFDKMEENLKMYAFDAHCRHIMFGCQDGEVYGPMLRRFAHGFGTEHRITLVCGTEPDKHLAGLRLPTAQMSDIFRNTRIDTHNVVDFIPPLNPSAVRLMDTVTPPLSASTTSRPNSRLAQDASLSYINAHSRQVSVTSSVNSAEPAAAPIRPKVGSWAMAAQKGAAVKVPPPSIAKEPQGSFIRRNKKGQRIDPPTPEFKKDEVNRLKKLKLCNAHHLRHDCPYADGKCTHDHMYKLTKQELETLKLVARMSACIHGSECDDPKCIYGHRCPFPEAREGSMRGKACINGENCRFPAHMHGMDMKEVRVVKIS